VSFVVASWIYLTGNLQDSIGVFTSYDLADFLYGPVLSASLITVFYVLRERIGKSAVRRMDLALLAAVLSAVGMAAVAFIRASNRHYHLIHPELNLENSIFDSTEKRVIDPPQIHKTLIQLAHVQKKHQTPTTGAD
jgi:hypothetical protein